eukprot:gene19164-21084_t
MKKGYVRLPQFPESLTAESSKSKFRFSIRTPNSEEPQLTPVDHSDSDFEVMSGANVPLIGPGSNFDDEDYLSEGNRQNYGLQSNDKSRRQKGLCSRCWWFLCGGWKEGCSSCCQSFTNLFKKQPDYQPRKVYIARKSTQSFPKNVVRNQKYSVISFIPLVLINQFKIFLNMYFLVVALSQFIPSLKIGYLYTYWGPLGFVLAVTMCREAYDDFKRFLRDREANSKKYRKLTKEGIKNVPSSDIEIADLIYVEKDERVPADMVFLRTTDKTGTCFVRTDQLDGETDWKLRIAVDSCQRLLEDEDLLRISACVYAEEPKKDIHSFVGTYTRKDGDRTESPLNVENVLWSNTVVASGTALGVVIYTGRETRSVMNTSVPTSKFGLLDIEINNFTKLLFILTVALSLAIMGLKGFTGPWWRYFFRFILLFSYIIPISLRVNLDMAKLVYSWMIGRDGKIPGTVVRSSTIPEELGRINYLLSDKTGTLTQNEMVFKRLHLGTVSFGTDSIDEVRSYLRTTFEQSTDASVAKKTGSKIRRNVVTRVQEAVKALSLCHNVTPVVEEHKTTPAVVNGDIEMAAQGDNNEVNYQAASPDEVALVTWSESVGLTLIYRDLYSMQLKTKAGQTQTYKILQMFPFTSETKRMGIIIQEEKSGEITFYMKGADTVMNTRVQYNDWLEEECGNMAREGLRTLVVAKKTLTEDQYADFEYRYSQAKLSMEDRNSKVFAVQESLEYDLELLCLTGVEDKLQPDVRPTLELLRNAGMKIWMLTGDKMETAICIAQSSRLVSKTQNIYSFKPVSNRSEAHLELNSFRRKGDHALVIKGDSLDVILRHYEHEFMELAVQCPAVVVCRCTPTQKAEIVRLLRVHTGKRTCAIGDGGNDVSMIQMADAGVGIVGKEGKQASLAADFSITQFSHLGRLLVWHGRNSYKRSAALSQFVIHRGLIISVMQAVFSLTFFFISVSLYQGFLMVGYATVYTMAPVFSLVLDEDVSDEIALRYPELYKDLVKGRILSFKTFFLWLLISIYQGGIIMFGALLLFEDDFIHIVSISFTALILTELLMVALTVRTWHWLMALAEVCSLSVYIASVVLFRRYFDEVFFTSGAFYWKVTVITLVSCLPLYILKFLRKTFAPPSYSKLS